MTDPPEEQAAWPPSGLLQYLPAIYSESPFLCQFLLAFEKLLFGINDGVKLEEKRAPAFEWLKAFMAPWFPRELLSPLFEQAAPPALERQIAGIAAYWIPRAIDDDPDHPLVPAGDDIPREAPRDFLPWLASWTAFTLRFDLTEKQQREFIARVISLYRARGTKASLVELLKIFTTGEPTVEDLVSGRCTAGSINGRTLTVGGTVTGTWAPGQRVSGGTTADNTYIDRQAAGYPGGAGTYEVSVCPGGAGTYAVSISQTVAAAPLAGNFDAHCFSATLRLARYEIPGADPDRATAMLRRQMAIADALVELDKPAHTFCTLTYDFPSMQIGMPGRSRVGIDTLLGTISRSPRSPP